MTRDRVGICEKLATSVAVLLGLGLFLPGQAAAQKNVTIVLSAEPDSLDGCMSTRSVTGRVVKQNIVETLTEIDAKDGSVKPRLATSWEKVNDTTWRFKLRQGVTFTDGVPFNAESVAKSISRIMDNKELPCEVRTKRFGDLQIKGVPVDDFTIDIVANKADPILATRMGVVTLSSPNTQTDKLVWTPVGTGPYVLERFTPGQEGILRRNDKYWGAKPEVEVARYVWRAESSVRAAMVEIGEADLAPDIGAQDARNPTLDYSYPNSETTYGRIDHTIPPLNDRRIRLALNLAIDREALRGSVLSKDVIHATQVVGPAIGGHNHELDKRVRPFDQAEARNLIAAAKADGVPVDTKITILGRIGYYPNTQEVGEAFLNYWKAVGFNADLKMMESTEWSRHANRPMLEGRGAQVLLHQHDNNAGDPVFSMFSRYTCNGNSSGMCNEDLDKQIAKATGLTGQERVVAWREAFRMVYEDVVADIFMYHMVGYARVDKRIKYVPNISTNSEIHLADMAFK